MKESNKVTNVGYLKLNGKEVTLEQFYEGVETATSVGVYGCNTLKNLTANAATSVYVYDCSALESLTANAATSVSVYACEALESITANTATSVVVSGCSDLKSLTANAATDVDVSYCSALKRFENENLKLIANSTYGLFVSKDGLYSAGCAQNLTLDEALNRLDRDDERAIIFTSAILTHLDN
jgi:hypothetical protein